MEKEVMNREDLLKKAKNELNFNRAKNIWLALANLFILNYYIFNQNTRDYISLVICVLWVIVALLGASGLLYLIVDNRILESYSRYLSAKRIVYLKKKVRRTFEKNSRKEVDMKSMEDEITRLKKISGQNYD